jgi:hypothetical protein
MASQAPFLPTAQLVALAQSGPAMALPFDTRQSYPIPARKPGGGLSAVFVYAPHGRLNPVEGLHLLAPTFVAHVDAATGKLERVRRITLLAGHAPGQDIGAHTMPKGLTYDTFMPLEAQLFQDYDAVLPSFAADLTQLFWRLSEAPLSPYYEALGGDFFAWLAAIAP